MKNRKIRKEMFLKAVTQQELAEILGLSGSEVSVMLKYELAKSEQDHIISKIKEATEAEGA